jgi:phage terminase large subunit
MGEVTFNFNPYPKQIEFFKSTQRYVAYGGARGGGKSWAARTKATLLALNYEGIQILLLRRTLQELRENHILPLQVLLKDIAKYDAQNKEFSFPNRARMKFGYCAAESDVLQYQGQAYDVIFLEEATQFTEFQKDTLTESNRSSGQMVEKFTPRMYFTMNPGGVGHAWAKRLFIDREYRNKERKENYEFIPSTVYENKYLMDNNPEYVENLENLPEMRKRAMLYGDWDAFEGQYFPEFNRDIHVIKPFDIPKEWNRFISLDYGMDMVAAYWWAVDTEGNCIVYRELHEPGLILSAAAKRIVSLTGDEKIRYVVASPDLWNKRQETGESGAEIMRKNGLLHMQQANNSRIPGWRTMREYLKPVTDRYNKQSSRLKFFSNCVMAIKHIPLLQYDDKKLEDAASEPHEITHACESIRYGIMSRPRLTEIPVKSDPNNPTPQEKYNKMVKDVTGGQVPQGFFNFNP